MIIAKHISKLATPHVSLHKRVGTEDYYEEYLYCRTDIACVSVWDICNCFFGVNGFEQIDLYEGVTCDEEGKKHLIKICTEAFNEQVKPEFIQEQREFFKRLKERKVKSHRCLPD